MKHANKILATVALLLLVYVVAYVAMAQTVDLGEAPHGRIYGRRYRIKGTAVQFVFAPLRAIDEQLRGEMHDLDRPKPVESAPPAAIPFDELPEFGSPPSSASDPYRQNSKRPR